MMGNSQSVFETAVGLLTKFETNRTKNGVFGLRTHQPADAGPTGQFCITHHFVSSFLRGATSPKIRPINFNLVEKIYPGQTDRRQTTDVTSKASVYC